MTHSAHEHPTPKTSLECRLSHSGLSLEDIQTLQMARHVFQSFAQPASQSWMHAIDLAYSEPNDRDPQTFYRVLSVVQAVRCARVSLFRFSNPCCANCAQTVTAHERQFMSCITSAKRGRLEEAERHAFLLCEGNDTRLVMTALHGFYRAEAAPETQPPVV